MKNVLCVSLAIVLANTAFCQKESKWKFDGIQFNVGGIMNSKLPNNNLFMYSNYIYTADSTILSNGFTPNVRTNLRMTPSIGINLHWRNSLKNTSWRLGLYYNRKNISSFGLYKNAVYDTISGQWSNDYNEVRLSHSAPALNLDLAWLKGYSFNNKLEFNIGIGGYLGSSFGNKIGLFTYTNQFSPINNQFLSFNNTFERFSFNGGVYALLGFNYCLNNQNQSKQQWYLTYESRFGGDYFGRQGYVFQGFSYQNTHLIGLKYKFSKTAKK